MSAVESAIDDFGQRNIRIGLFLIAALAAAVRCYIWYMSPVVNPDGVLYIHQARNFFEGRWGELTSCGLSFFSIYPVLTAMLYPALQDWVISARIISILFGTLTVFPVYLAARKVTRRKTALLAAVIFAVLPGAAGAAGQVVRDLVCWFFIAWGLVFFLHQDGRERFRVCLFLSCSAFLLASWARVESLVFVAASILYLVFFGGNKRVMRTIFFLLPVAGAVVLGIIMLETAGIDVAQAFRLREVAEKMSAPFLSYASLRKDLRALSTGMEGAPLEGFISHARHSVWFIGLFSLFNSILRALLYFYGILLAAGLWKLVASPLRVKGHLYSIVLSFCSFILLYFHLIHVWVMDTRFVMIFVIAAFPLIASGIDAFDEALFRKTALSAKRSYIFLLAGIMLLGIWNDYGFSERDKMVFRQIGEKISEDSPSGRRNIVAASQVSMRWISFYANAKAVDPPCPQPGWDLKTIAEAGYASFVGNLKSLGASYLVWDELHWPRNGFDLLKEMYPNDFKEMGRWTHPSTGEMILFKCMFNMQ